MDTTTELDVDALSPNIELQEVILSLCSHLDNGALKIPRKLFELKRATIALLLKA